MKPPVRALLTSLALFGVLLAGTGSTASASTADLEFTECAHGRDGVGEGECQHFLRNPAGATDDPCWCDKCRNGITGQQHDGRTVPSDWNPVLFETGGMDGYLKRHSVMWGITCSECFESQKPWPDGGGGGDLGTVPQSDFGGRPAWKTVTARLEAEKRMFKKPDEVVLAYNKYAYVVTDIEGLKVRMPGGSARVISRHEWLHLMVERCSFAKREWLRNLGDPLTNLPIAIYLTEKQRDQERISAEYFKGAGSKGLRGNGAVLSDGICMTGIAFSREKTGDDTALHVTVRHQMAHNLFSIWGTHEIRPNSLPEWIDEGLGHWLSKSIDKLRDEAAFCASEAQSTGGGGGGRGGGGALTFSTKDWEVDVAKYAASSKLIVIEELLAKRDVKHMDEVDQKRAWSYCDLGLAEWRDGFVKLARALRQEKDLREAFMTSLGCTPEVFDERWRDRVLGRRKTFGPLPTEDEPEGNAGPGASDRRSLRSETNPATLAAKVRALGEITDKKTIPVVVDVFAQNSDLVRETALVTLLKTKDPECLEVLWNYGLAHSDGIVRAYTAKVCGRLGLEFALPKLEAQLADKNWYARAEAAVACGMLKHAPAMAALRKMVSSDSAPKAQIAAMDALAMFGEGASMGVPLIAKHLDSSHWQLRIAATQALGEIGSMEAVEPLISRMEKETGRIREDGRDALKKIVRDDLGRRPEDWRKWWDRQKANVPGGGIPQRPEEVVKEEPKKSDPNDPRATRDAPPPYFGVEIYSNRVAFVIDTTQTMLTLFTPDPNGAKALSREYAGRDKLTICKEEVAQALQGLDPRAHFNIVAFGMTVRAFKQNPVLATSGNVETAIGFLRSLSGAGRTNYYGALKTALDLGDEPDTNPGFRATPDTITFLTDGLPNEGDIIDADTLVEWYTGLNRYARVRTHTITFGTVGVDQPLLGNLATRNGGRFVLVPELKRKDK